MVPVTLLLAFLIPSIKAQAGPEAFSIYNSTGRLPDGCIDGYTSGRDEYVYVVPYTYAQVLSVIGSFANITWNGINATTLNGTDNTVGTARFYETFGISLVETIKTYEKPPNGPYFEDHTLAPAYNPTADLSIYSAVDIQVATPICGGTATSLNFTIEFCSTNVSAAGPILHDSHVFDATTLQAFLGNDTWTGCTNDNSTGGTGVIGGPSGGTATGAVGPTATGGGAGSTNGTSVVAGGAGPTAAAFTGGASVIGGGFGYGGGALAAGVIAALLL